MEKKTTCEGTSLRGREVVPELRASGQTQRDSNSTYICTHTHGRSKKATAVLKKAALLLALETYRKKQKKKRGAGGVTCPELFSIHLCKSENKNWRNRVAISQSIIYVAGY